MFSVVLSVVVVVACVMAVAVATLPDKESQPATTEPKSLSGRGALRHTARRTTDRLHATSRRVGARLGPPTASVGKAVGSATADVASATMRGAQAMGARTRHTAWPAVAALGRRIGAWITGVSVAMAMATARGSRVVASATARAARTVASATARAAVAVAAAVGYAVLAAGSAVARAGRAVGHAFAVVGRGTRRASGAHLPGASPTGVGYSDPSIPTPEPSPVRIPDSAPTVDPSRVATAPARVAGPAGATPVPPSEPVDLPVDLPVDAVADRAGAVVPLAATPGRRLLAIGKLVILVAVLGVTFAAIALTLVFLAGSALASG